MRKTRIKNKTSSYDPYGYKAAAAIAESRAKEFSSMLEKLRCDHDYEMVYSDFEKESYRCTKCGSGYSLWYEDMK